MKRILMMILSLWVALTASADNIVTLSSAEGHPGDEVTVTVSLDNSDAVTAQEIRIPLNSYLKYVDGSCELNSSRSDGHALSAGSDNGELRIYVYSFALKPLKGNSGQVCTFRLLLGKAADTFSLTPTVKLSDTSGKQVASSANDLQVKVVSPRLEVVNTEINYGHIPIRSTYTQNLQLRNTGNEALQVSGLTFSASEFSSEQSFEIAAGQSKNVQVVYSPVNRGAISEKVTIESNAVNGKRTATLIADPFSVNELHVGNAAGVSDSEVEISLTMNNMEPIVAMQCEFELPEALEYVDGSFATAERSSMQTAQAVANGKKLRLLLFNLSNTPISGDDGVVGTFRLKLNGRSGNYNLNPSQVKLSNSTQENMTSAVYQGRVQIQSPTISANSTFDFGDHPLTEKATATYQIRNNGQVPLVIDNVAFLEEGFSIVESMPISIERNETKNITIEHLASKAGAFSTQMNIYSNDPESRMYPVKILGSAFEPNNFSMVGTPSDNYDAYSIDVSLDNYTQLVALQMDVVCPEGLSVSQSDFVATERLKNHLCTLAKKDDTTYRLVVFSMNNTPISGNSGKLFSLIFHNNSGRDVVGKQIIIKNIIQVSTTGENYSSQTNLVYNIGAISVESLGLNAPSSTLTVYGTMQMEASVLPANASNPAIVWSSDNENVAQVDQNGLVLALAVGKATITATTTDGSNISASHDLIVTLADDDSDIPIFAVGSPLGYSYEDLDNCADEDMSLVIVATLGLTDESIVEIGAVMPDGTVDWTNNGLGETDGWRDAEGNWMALGADGCTYYSQPYAKLDNGVWHFGSVMGAAPDAITQMGIHSSTFIFKANDKQCYLTFNYVSTPPVIAEAINVAAPTYCIQLGKTVQVAATISPENVSVKSVTWTSSNENVATVDADGMVTAISAGTATITATTTDGSDLSASCEVTVVPTELQNGTFDDAADLITENIRTYEKDIIGTDVAWMQPVSGWKIVSNGDGHAAGVFEYASKNFIGGAGYLAPASDPEGNTEGGCLGILGVWAFKAVYTQEVSMPAGDYEYTYFVYNVGGTGAVVENNFGVVVGDKAFYSEDKTFAVNAWTKYTVPFTVAEDGTIVTFSLGYVAANAGSSGMPHLFVDNVTVENLTSIDTTPLTDAIAAAQETLATYPEDSESYTILSEAIAAAQAAVETIASNDDLVAAIDALKAGESAAAQAAFLLGDVDADGTVDVTDAVILIGHYLQDTTDKLKLPVADINKDNVIDVTDAVGIIQIYLNNQ